MRHERHPHVHMSEWSDVFLFFKLHYSAALTFINASPRDLLTPLPCTPIVNAFLSRCNNRVSTPALPKENCDENHVSSVFFFDFDDRCIIHQRTNNHCGISRNRYG